MYNNSRILTSCQAANVLGISENTVNALANMGKIPHIYNGSGDGATIHFRTDDIINWLNCGPSVNMNDQKSIAAFGKQIEKKFSKELAELREFDKQFAPRRAPKGYSLHKVKSKKIGFAWYVRYTENGKTVPTRWSTHTNNREAAEAFALRNRKKLLAAYHKRKSQGMDSGAVYAVFRNFYKENSEYQKNSIQRGQTLGDTARRTYQNNILNYWIPFCKKQRVKTFDDIDTPMMARYQDYCLARGAKPQTVNHYAGFVSTIFDYLATRGKIKANPCAGLPALKVKEKHIKIRGCYHVNELQGIFARHWKDEMSYLLNLIIYSTGMRNSEMDRMQAKDIIRINNCRFINIPKSKTRYGARLVPLHDFVYGKLARYIKKYNKGPEDLLFCQKNGKRLPRQRYTDANIALGMFTRRDKNKKPDIETVKEKLEKENITFYSGRHFWKTLMNAHELGEVEEYFMGHKVTADVAERYNHRDKQGQEKITAKAREVFKILDKKLFAQGA